MFDDVDDYYQVVIEVEECLYLSHIGDICIVTASYTVYRVIEIKYYIYAYIYIHT